MSSSSPGPRGPVAPAEVPYGRTARRLDWLLLPPNLRRMVEDRFGTRVVSAASDETGFTPGCESVLTGSDGRTLLLKAASRRAQRPFAAAYAEEARWLRTLRGGDGVPRLLWSYQDDLWVVLAEEHLDGTHPTRPWDRHQLDLCLDRLEALARALTPAPVPAPSLADELTLLPAAWDHVRTADPDRPHTDEAAALAAGFAEATAGRTLLHTDVGDEAWRITPAGAATLSGWTYPALGAAWVDTVCLLLSAAVDGVAVDAVLAQRALTRDVDAEQVDVLLALLCGWYLRQRDLPAPYSSPFLRRHQSRMGEAAWAWLCRRRGWC